MKQTLAKHIANKQTIEDAFQGIGYFAATSAVVQVCLPIIREKGLLTKFGFLAIIYGLLVLSGYYLAVHVIRPFVKVFYPNFTLRHADDNHVERKGFRRNLKRPGALLFAMLLLITLYLGWTLVEMTLLFVSKTAV